VIALQKAGKVKSLASLIESVDTPKGRRRVFEHLKSRPFPHYEPHPRKAGVLVRIESDGTRTEGRFVDRQFKASE
jgi:hypothetical protein